MRRYLVKIAPKYGASSAIVGYKLSHKYSADSAKGKCNHRQKYGAGSAIVGYKLSHEYSASSAKKKSRCRTEYSAGSAANKHELFLVTEKRSFQLSYLWISSPNQVIPVWKIRTVINNRVCAFYKGPDHTRWHTGQT